MVDLAAVLLDPRVVDAEAALLQVADDGLDALGAGQRAISASSLSREPSRTSTWMSPSRLRSSSSTRWRPMKPVAPVTK